MEGPTEFQVIIGTKWNVCWESEEETWFQATLSEPRDIFRMDAADLPGDGGDGGDDDDGDGDDDDGGGGGAPHAKRRKRGDDKGRGKGAGRAGRGRGRSGGSGRGRGRGRGRDRGASAGDGETLVTKACAVPEADINALEDAADDVGGSGEPDNNGSAVGNADDDDAGGRESVQAQVRKYKSVVSSLVGVEDVAKLAPEANPLDRQERLT